MLQCGSEDVKRHRWFKHLDWADVFMKKLQVILTNIKYKYLQRWRYNGTYRLSGQYFCRIILPGKAICILIL